MYLPEWIQPFKERGTEIKKIREHYYKYAVSYKYDREKKKTIKKTERLLGKITQKDGFVPSSKNELRLRNEELPQVDIKTFGIYHLFSDLMKEEISSLHDFFGEGHADTLLSFAMMRWAYQTPIKRAREYHSHDFCSELWATKSFSDKTVSATLKYFGENRQTVVEWMKTQLKDVPDEQNFVLMDSTHALSVSGNLAVNAKGYNPDFDFEKQIRLMYLFSAQMKQPVYYRLINGNITDVKSMSLCINEMKVNNKVVFIADKGFFSAENIGMMNEENLSYIIPLHRNNSLIDFSPLEKPDFKKELKYFIFQERIIWYYSYRNGNYNMITFLDEALRIKEERDYLSRIETHPESYSRDGFDKKLHQFGTLTIVYKVDDNQIKSDNKNKKSKKKPAKEKTIEQIIYESYKQRNGVEVMFDSYKNCLDADVLYMQNRYVLEGWLFANFIAMIAYYKLYTRLLQAEILSKYSPKDIIELSKSIYKMKIRNTWRLSEITQKTQRLFTKIQIDYLI